MGKSLYCGTISKLFYADLIVYYEFGNVRKGIPFVAFPKSVLFFLPHKVSCGAKEPQNTLGKD